MLIEAAARVAPLTRFVTIDTGVLFPETLDTWRAFEERFGIHVEVEDARGDWIGRQLLLGRARSTPSSGRWPTPTRG